MWLELMCIVAISIEKTNGQVSGCPLYGCTPSGSFSLDPVLTSPDVHIAWTAKIDNSSGSRIQYGCVSNGDTVVCPTSNGYVSLDPKNGTELWRTKVLLRPSLPLVDIYGNVIGCDGPSLVKIDSDGNLEPIIHLELPVDSIYSLNLMVSSNALIIVSDNGMVVAYLTNGVPLASLQLNGTVNGQNGTFHPIAAPVVSGYRTYVLTEFQHAGPQHVHCIRLFALEITDAISDRIRIAWFVDLQTDVGPPIYTEADILLKLYLNHIGLSDENENKREFHATFRLSNSDNLSEKTHPRLSNILIDSDIVYISLSSLEKSHKANDKTYPPTLFAINATTTPGQKLFQNIVSLSNLASDSISSQNNSRSSPLQSVIWANNRTHILAFDAKTGKLFREFNISSIFQNGVNIMSNLMLPESGSKQFRVYAVDVIRRMDKIISVAWYIDLNYEPTMEIGRRQASLLVTGDKILISLSFLNSSKLLNGTYGMLWSIKDRGSGAELVYRTTSNIGKLSLFNGNQKIQSFKSNANIANFESLKTSSGTSNMGLNLLWGASVTGNYLIGVMWQNGATVFQFPIASVYGDDFLVTTNVMVGQKKGNVVLTFGMRDAKGLGSLITALEVGDDKPQVLWIERIPYITSGQIVTLQNQNQVNVVVVSSVSSNPVLFCIAAS